MSFEDDDEQTDRLFTCNCGEILDADDCPQQCGCGREWDKLRKLIPEDNPREDLRWL